MLKRVDGNLIDLAQNGVFTHILHGCNCFCTMGSGIAREIAYRYPEAREVDRTTVSGDKTKLGRFTYANVEAPSGHNFIIINGYTQYRYGVDRVNFDVDALKGVLSLVLKKFHDAKLGVPYIGMGLARGDPDVIIPMLEEFAIKMTSSGGEVTLVRFV